MITIVVHKILVLQYILVCTVARCGMYLYHQSYMRASHLSLISLKKKRKKESAAPHATTTATMTGAKGATAKVKKQQAQQQLQQQKEQQQQHICIHL